MSEAPAKREKAAGNSIGDAELAEAMAAYQGGNMEAFQTIYVALGGPLGGYLGALARDRSVADDLLQETFLQVHRVRHTYQPPRPVRPWLYAIARNVFLMHRRSTSRRGRHEAIADDALPEVPILPDVEGLGDRETIRVALTRLAEGRREALVLHHILGMSFREVGAVLGISEGAAKVRAHRALAELRELMRIPGGES
jgi:RNA polymerase sigma-70 factor (ECF subfamily)